jgi:hypothetical protein
MARRVDRRRLSSASGPRRSGIGAAFARSRVLYAVGTIVSGSSGFDPVNGDVVGSDTLVEQIRRVRDDRLDQGDRAARGQSGGSAVAST